MNMVETLLYTLKNYTDLMSEKDLLKLSSERNLAIAYVSLEGNDPVYLFAHSGCEKARENKENPNEVELYNLHMAKIESDIIKVKISTPLSDRYPVIPVMRKKPNGKDLYEVDQDLMKSKKIKKGKEEKAFQVFTREDTQETRKINNSLIGEMASYINRSSMCTERKLLSSILHYCRVNGETKGEIILFTVYPPCGDCDVLIEWFRNKYKHITLSVYDYSHYLNDVFEPEGKPEYKPIDISEVIRELNELKSKYPDLEIDGYISIDGVLANAKSLEEELKNKNTKETEMNSIKDS